MLSKFILCLLLTIPSIAADLIPSIAPDSPVIKKVAVDGYPGVALMLTQAEPKPQLTEREIETIKHELSKVRKRGMNARILVCRGRPGHRFETEVELPKCTVQVYDLPADILFASSELKLSIEGEELVGSDKQFDIAGGQLKVALKIDVSEEDIPDYPPRSQIVVVAYNDKPANKTQK